MSKNIFKGLLLMAGIALGGSSFAQNGNSGNGQIHGSTQIDAQIYQADKNIGIDSLKDGKKFGINGYTDLVYTKGNFSAGMRFEAYLPPLNGFENNYDGVGIPYRWAKYTSDQFEITAGNFYEQFGSGLVLRSYQEWNLGIDNSIDGGRIIVRPIKGVSITGVYGVQRNFWVKYENQNRGIVRGADADININSLLDLNIPLQINLGASFVSRFQKDNDQIYKLPENVGAGAARINLAYNGFDFYTEYAKKGQDPSAINNYIYHEGEALYSTLSYSTRGLGAMLQFKRLDNFSFKSDRGVTGQALDINYLPAISKQQTYALATLFPYATQPNGEIGYSAQISYKFKRKTLLGGKYGTLVSIDYSKVNDIQRTPIEGDNPLKAHTNNYTSDFFAAGKFLYETLNAEISKKFSRKFKTTLSYLYVKDNISFVEQHPGEPDIEQHAGIIDMTYKFNNNTSLHWELQHAFVNDPRTFANHTVTANNEEEVENGERAYQGRRGNWAGALAEINYKDFFFAAMDQYNYENNKTDFENHYYTFSAGYTHNTSRIALSYGRQREGLLCIGGVCRQVPAASGYSISITTSF
ncbi:MAG: DUF6029 family protein [Bacteroidales bacterium]